LQKLFWGAGIKSSDKIRKKLLLTKSTAILEDSIFGDSFGDRKKKHEFLHHSEALEEIHVRGTNEPAILQI